MNDSTSGSEDNFINSTSGSEDNFIVFSLRWLLIAPVVYSINVSLINISDCKLHYILYMERLSCEWQTLVENACVRD